MPPSHWMEVRPQGLYCRPADLYIDPMRPVDSAVITHGHADHARPGHLQVIATAQTHAIMSSRYGEACCQSRRELAYGERISLANDVTLWLAPAGHILGSAQVVLEYGGERLVISGDYKRSPDPTCEPFEVVPCDVFVTEATFALPVFRHPPLERALAEYLAHIALFPMRTHLLGVYALGKCQRILMGLRALGYERPVYLHGALIPLCELYEREGLDLGPWIAVKDVDTKTLRGELVLAPPSAMSDRWSRRLPDVLTAMASGWMQIRARARQRRVEVPLVVSDHADWDELLQTIREVNPEEVWVTHGREDALIHALQRQGQPARALSLVGYGDEDTD